MSARIDGEDVRPRPAEGRHLSYYPTIDRITVVILFVLCAQLKRIFE